MTDKLPFKLPKPDDKHFYDILNCAPSSTAAQIKAEFYSKARGAHPDKTGHAVGADENKCNDTEIARLNRAYDVLSDPEKRAKVGATCSMRRFIVLAEFLAHSPSSFNCAHFMQSIVRQIP